ncbi:NUDIX domain-containing protein [Natronococcus sp.]|uniref:NUDIX hydrolase n=1 Tax=Natronococcus sp. TaxID=35747 RepID=UPI0025CB835A|nr:NUDIX domain-containing protein [Natronococcus sp.]
MVGTEVPCVPKVCAYITRNGRELLTFEANGHDGLQVPKGTIEPGESPLEALHREVAEESGLTELESTRRLAEDVWVRRLSPPKLYRRHFFHVSVEEDRDRWTHVVTGDGEERGMEFEYAWRELPPARDFALSLDDYVDRLEPVALRPQATESR